MRPGCRSGGHGAVRWMSLRGFKAGAKHNVMMAGWVGCHGMGCVCSPAQHHRYPTCPGAALQQRPLPRVVRFWEDSAAPALSCLPVAQTCVPTTARRPTLAVPAVPGSPTPQVGARPAPARRTPLPRPPCGGLTPWTHGTGGRAHVAQARRVGVLPRAMSHPCRIWHKWHTHSTGAATTK